MKTRTYRLDNFSNPIENVNFMYKFHPSILLIKSKLENQRPFYFKPRCEMEKVQNIDSKMAATKNTFPPESLILNRNTSLETLQDLFNKC